MKLFTLYYESRTYNKLFVRTILLYRFFMLAVLLIWGGGMAYGQASGNIIYIAMDGRREIRLAPKVDTLTNGEEYTYKLTIDPQYTFSELFCEKGLAVRTDNFIRITPNSQKESGMDTITLRIILFGNGNRILFYKHIYVKVPKKDYQKLIRKQPDEVAMDNMVLERNLNYSKANFHANAVFNFISHDTISASQKKVLSVTISMVNANISKSFYIKGNQLTQEVIAEMRRQRDPFYTYIRIEAKIGRRTKTIWTRFTMTGGEKSVAAL